MYSDGIKKYAEELHRGQSERGEYTEAHLRSCTSPKVSRAFSLLQLGLQQGYRITHIHHIIRFKQAPFIFEYVNMLMQEKRMIVLLKGYIIVMNAIRFL